MKLSINWLVQAKVEGSDCDFNYRFHITIKLNYVEKFIIILTVNH